MNRRTFLLSTAILPSCYEEQVNLSFPKPLTIKSTRRPGKFVTPPPHCDVLAKHPGLLPLQSSALRLHPRKHPGLPPTASKIGGIFCNNAPETWPRCTEHDTPMIGGVQLSQKDFPEIPWPSSKDFFQLFWCPFDHDDGAYCPAMIGRWFKLDNAGSQRSENPSHLPPANNYQPNECEFNPEPVIEYPYGWALTGSLRKEIESDSSIRPQFPEWLKDMKGAGTKDTNRTAYAWFLSCAPGSKIGGHIHWVQDPQPINCPQCKQPTAHLLTLASWEWDGGDYLRWKPNPLSRSVPPVPGDGGDDHGMMFGDAGDIYIGVCRSCPDWPIARVMQCS